MGGESSRVELPSPHVEFGPGFLARLGAFAAHLAAAREREEVGRRRTLEGEGQEFVGHRPYRPGEDLRRLDWDLFARVDRPYVFVHRSDAREEWAVALDSSASMGVGRPGKLQSAAEVAAAIVALGLRLGARVALVAVGPGGRKTRIDASRTADLGRALKALESLVAEGRNGLGAFVGAEGRRPLPPIAPGGRGGAGRVFLLGDLIDLEPALVLPLAGGRRRVHVGQVLAPEEWEPEEWRSLADRSRAGASTLWVEPESGAGRVAGPDARRGYDGYARRVESFVEGWSALAAAHSITHRAWSTRDPFESFLPDLLR